MRGLTIEEIAAELAKLPKNRVAERADWAKLTGRWTSRIDTRIAELERLRTVLTACIGCGCLSLGACRVANPRDRLGRDGPGPRNWMAPRSDRRQ